MKNTNDERLFRARLLIKNQNMRNVKTISERTGVSEGDVRRLIPEYELDADAAFWLRRDYLSRLWCGGMTA